MNFHIKIDENLCTFLSRFFPLTVKHLLNARASPFSQSGQVLSIKLLLNANIDERTIKKIRSPTAANTQKNREERISEAVNYPHSVPMTSITPILVASQAFYYSSISMNDATNREKGKKKLLSGFLNALQDLTSQLQAAIFKLDYPEDTFLK